METRMFGCNGKGFEVGGMVCRETGNDGTEMAHEQLRKCLAYAKGCYHGMPYVKITQGWYGRRGITTRVILPVRY